MLQKVSDDHVQKWVVRTFFGEKNHKFSIKFCFASESDAFFVAISRLGKMGGGGNLDNKTFRSLVIVTKNRKIVIRV